MLDNSEYLGNLRISSNFSDWLEFLEHLEILGENSKDSKYSNISILWRVDRERQKKKNKTTTQNIENREILQGIVWEKTTPNKQKEKLKYFSRGPYRRNNAEYRTTQNNTEQHRTQDRTTQNIKHCKKKKNRGFAQGSIWEKIQEF